jgi:hypothetical protein
MGRLVPEKTETGEQRKQPDLEADGAGSQIGIVGGV